MSVKQRSLIVAIVSAVLVLLLTMAAAKRQSPGPVSSVHARIDDLDGGEACSTCHGGWLSDMQTACNESSKSDNSSDSTQPFTTLWNMSGLIAISKSRKQLRVGGFRVKPIQCHVAAS